ncbi:MAG: endonuclease/exonuclease/phosphatase family protein [Saprospiraceae bacterium]|nr:endonuclease/exonuclease/phosphatase family protein [Saprospiraceae bacterium]
MILKRISSHASQIMLLLLGSGLFFLLFDQKRLLFTAFGCVAALCLHFKQVANIDLVAPIKTTEPSITIAQVSTVELAEHWETSVTSLIQSDADVISILEITPDWEMLLEQQLKDAYPYSAILTRIDILGVGIFSKIPMARVDTLTIAEVPHLRASLEVGEYADIALYSFNTNPPLFRTSLLQLRNQLSGLSAEIDAQGKACITAGNFNLDQFADEIQDFRAKARLFDSRKTMSPSLNTPTSHIFYNSDFECLTFTNLYDNASYRIGIIGEYQLKRK